MRPGFIIGVVIVLLVLAGLWLKAYRDADHYTRQTGGNAGTNGNP